MTSNAHDHPWRKPLSPRRWRRIKDNEMLALYEQAINTKPITICPPGEKTEVTYWEIIPDPRYDYVTGKVDAVLDEDFDA